MMAVAIPAMNSKFSAVPAMVSPRQAEGGIAVAGDPAAAQTLLTCRSEIPALWSGPANTASAAGPAVVTHIHRRARKLSANNASNAFAPSPSSDHDTNRWLGRGVSGNFAQTMIAPLPYSNFAAVADLAHHQLLQRRKRAGAWLRIGNGVSRHPCAGWTL